MKIIKPRTFDIEDRDRKRFYEEIYKMFSRNISFGSQIDSEDQNVNGHMVQITDTGAANTEFVVTHNLGRIPNFYDVKYIDKATNIYDSGTSWTMTQIFLKSSIANVKVTLFVH